MITDNDNRYCFTINALSHCGWSDCPEQLLELAQGKKVLLVAEDDNADPNAVRVHFGGKVAGYVCRDDAPYVRALILRDGRQSRLALVTGFVTEPFFKLKGVCEYADPTALTIDDHLNRQFDEWVYTGPLLPPSHEQNLLEGAVEYLSYVIGGELEWDGESSSYFDVFLSYHRQDFSDEMFNFRHQLVKFFESNSGMNRESRLMERELHEMSKHEHRESIGRYIASLAASKEFQQMMQRHGHIDLRTMLEQMANFPENLTGMLLKDCYSFMKRLYYLHPRRKVLRRFFSGITLVMFCRQNGLLQQPLGGPSDIGIVNQPQSQAQSLPLSGLDRLANQLNIVLGQNPSTGY